MDNVKEVVSLFTDTRKTWLLYEEVWFQRYPTRETHNNVSYIGEIMDFEPNSNALIRSKSLEKDLWIPIERIFSSKEEAEIYVLPGGSCEENQDACEVLNKFLSSEEIGTKVKTTIVSIPSFSISPEGREFKINMEFLVPIDEKKTKEIERRVLYFTESILKVLTWQ